MRPQVGEDGISVAFQMNARAFFVVGLDELGDLLMRCMRCGSSRDELRGRRRSEASTSPLREEPRLSWDHEPSSDRRTDVSIGQEAPPRMPLALHILCLRINGTGHSVSRPYSYVVARRAAALPPA